MAPAASLETTLRTGGPPAAPGFSSETEAGEFARMWCADDAAELELLYGRYRNHRFVPHTHEAYSVGVVTRGAMSYDYRRAVFTAPAGTISIVEPGEVHTGFAGAECGWSYRNFFVGADLMRRIADASSAEPGLPRFASPVMVDRPLAERMLRLHRTLETSHEPLERESDLFEVLSELLTRHSSHRSESAPLRSRPAVRRACEYLRDTLEENVSLEQVATVAGYSPYHFLRIFRREVGLTPHGYQLKVRIDRAVELLDGSTPLAEAALECGFADQSHLTRRFKQVLGVTPGQYLRGHA